MYFTFSLAWTKIDNLCQHISDYGMNTIGKKTQEFFVKFEWRFEFIKNLTWIFYHTSYPFTYDISGMNDFKSHFWIGTAEADLNK